MLALHEFRTDQRPADKSSHNGAELTRFGEAVIGCALPAPSAIPWCVRVPDVVGVAAALYVAHVVTDLRAGTVVGSSA
jgi:hypothetical protein